jgi:hypothetical protein
MERLPHRWIVMHSILSLAFAFAIENILKVGDISIVWRNVRK